MRYPVVEALTREGNIIRLGGEERGKKGMPVAYLEEQRRALRK